MSYAQQIIALLTEIAENTRPRRKKREAEPFKPPTLAEVAEYAGSGFDAQRWFDFYTAKGWMIGKNKMKDWKAAVRTWKRLDNNHNLRKGKLLAIPGKICCVRGCKMPAVYKDVSGAYDNYYCSQHMPAKVKQQYE